jgi:S-methylmethionine-dependent homocysteine/selenocysteine methylase
MGETGLPHVVSFVLDGDGRVLDGTLLHAAIECIDAATSPRPMFYSISCVHPSIAARALWNERAFSDLVARRLVGFKANASALSTEELVRLDHPEGDDPESFAGAGCGGSTKSSAYASSAVVAAQATDTHVP